MIAAPSRESSDAMSSLRRDACRIEAVASGPLCSYATVNGHTFKEEEEMPKIAAVRFEGGEFRAGLRGGFIQSGGPVRSGHVESFTWQLRGHAGMPPLVSEPSAKRRTWR
jgi:hypothetical protein